VFPLRFAKKIKVQNPLKKSSDGNRDLAVKRYLVVSSCNLILIRVFRRNLEILICSVDCIAVLCGLPFLFPLASCLPLLSPVRMKLRPRVHSPKLKIYLSKTLSFLPHQAFPENLTTARKQQGLLHL